MLIKCPECGKENISDRASKCPNCGYPFKKQTSAFWKEYDRRLGIGCGIIIGIIIIVPLLVVFPYITIPILLIFGGVALYFFNKKHKTK